MTHTADCLEGTVPGEGPRGQSVCSESVTKNPGPAEQAQGLGLCLA